jgi:hypothetical protein
MKAATSSCGKKSVGADVARIRETRVDQRIGLGGVEAHVVDEMAWSDILGLAAARRRVPGFETERRLQRHPARKRHWANPEATSFKPIPRAAVSARKTNGRRFSTFG